MAGLPGGGPRSSPGSAGGGDDTQHIAIAQAHIGRAQQKADEICAVLQPALHRDEPARAGVCGDEDERRALREQVAALQQELAALRACLPATSTTVASDTVEPASNTVETEETAPRFPHELMIALSMMDFTERQREFDAHADLGADGDGTEGAGRRMGKRGLAGLMRAHGLAHGDAEVERVLARIDANGNGEIDFGEFCALARANSDLEQAVRAKRPDCVLAAFFPTGTALEDLGTMSRAQFSAVVDKSHGSLVQLLVDIGAQMKHVAMAAQHAAQSSSKFNAELKGGTLDDFYHGVTGICGQPSADLEKGMEEEYTQRADSRVKFSTPNYGLKTDPCTEYQLVVSGGAGCAKAEGGAEEAVVVTGTRGCCKGGETQPDVRVLRPIEYYGDFGADGRLKDPLPRDSDTPMRRRVKMAGLWRFEVFALVLYSGPMYVLLNSILRGFGFCGAVKAGIEFASDEFWAQWKAVDINAWVERSGHKFTNTCHALASAIKKLQRLADEPVGTRLYRGLGGLDVRTFLKSRGFTDRAFMSTTKSREIALHYSGVNNSKVGTVLCIEVSMTNNGAVITAFSQYPGENETLWNACSYVEYKGEEEVALPKGGVVKLYHVLVSANSSAETVETLMTKRKLTVTTMAANQRHAIMHSIQARGTAGPEVQASILRQYDRMEEQLAARDAAWYNNDQQYRAAIGEALETMGFVPDMLEMNELRLKARVPDKANATYKLRVARRFMMIHLNARRLKAGADSPEAREAALALCGKYGIVTGGDGALERLNEVGETPLIQAAADNNIRGLRFLLAAGAEVHAKETYGRTALSWAANMGSLECVDQLLEHGAKVEAAGNDGMTCLMYSAKRGQDACLARLLAAKANMEAADKKGFTALLWSAHNGHDGCLRQLLAAKANVEAANINGTTALMMSALNGHEDCLRQLLAAKADVQTVSKQGSTALKLAEQNKHGKCAELLQMARAAQTPAAAAKARVLLGAAGTGDAAAAKKDEEEAPAKAKQEEAAAVQTNFETEEAAAGGRREHGINAFVGSYSTGKTQVSITLSGDNVSIINPPYNKIMAVKDFMKYGEDGSAPDSISLRYYGHRSTPTIESDGTAHEIKWSNGTIWTRL